MMIVVNDQVVFMAERDTGMFQHIQDDICSKSYK